MNSPFLEHFEQALEQWQDERVLSREDIRVWFRFHMYLVNLSEADGWTYDGHSLRMGEPMCLLVVRATFDGVAHVAFSSGRTPTGSMRAFLRKMEEGWLEWQVDRFR